MEKNIIYCEVLLEWFSALSVEKSFLRSICEFMRMQLHIETLCVHVTARLYCGKTQKEHMGVYQQQLHEK